MTIDKVCNYIAEILSFDAASVVIARENYELTDFAKDTIIVDTLNATIVSKQTKFDDVNEVMDLDTITSSVFTIDFYGENAYSNMMTFVNMQSSQLAYDLMKSHSISIYHSTTPRNLKSVGGATIYDRWQIEINVVDTIRNTIDTLRIDEAQLSIITN